MLTKTDTLLHVLYFSVQVNLAFFLFDNVGGLLDGFSVARGHLLGLHASTLVVTEDSIFLLISCLGVRFTVEKHLRPALISPEHLQNFLIVIIVCS